MGTWIAFKPPGARIAAWLLRKALHVEGRSIGLPSRRLERLSKNISAHLNQPIFTAAVVKEEAPEDALFAYCSSRPAIHEILAQHGLQKEYMAALYHAILMQGGAQWAG